MTVLTRKTRVFDYELQPIKGRLKKQALELARGGRVAWRTFGY